MAHATLLRVPSPAGAVSGEGWYAVADVSPWTAPFLGAVGSTCSALRLHGARSASYQWRSRADVVLDLARAVVAGVVRLDEARREPAFEQYVLRTADDAAGLDADSDPDPAVFGLELCARIARGEVDLFAHDEVYYFEADLHLADAAAALGPLPGWARTEVRADGGPGSGFNQPFLVLAEGHGLQHLRDALRRGVDPTGRERMEPPRSAP